jgi:hypothetical protein
MIYAAELQHRREVVERNRGRQARVTELTAERLRLEQEGNAALRPLERAMEAARAAWEEATQAYDAQRIKNQGALVSCNNEIAALTQELHRSRFDDRVENWGVPSWYTPEVPPLEPAWLKK